MSELSAKDVASYFLALVDEDAGELITHLKLQKLCYYAQGFSLALRGGPLFKEPIQAWLHGPVVPALWHEYKVHAAAPISNTGELDLGRYDEQTQALLKDVYQVYGQFSAWKLREMTHQEPPWREAWKIGPNSEIGHHQMADFFSTLVTD